MTEMVETVKHKKKGSTFKWFILAFIPILDLYLLWKVAALIAAHETAIMQKDKVE